MINASVSGETTQGGLARLPRALQIHKPAIVIIELGGNDGLRGLPLATSRENLRKSIELASAAQARVVLIGMMIPPNYGQRWPLGFRTCSPRSPPATRSPWHRSGQGRAESRTDAERLHPRQWKGQPRMLEMSG